MTSTTPTRIAQVALHVGDLARAKHFYGDQLGLQHLFDAPPALAFFQCGETRLMLSAVEGAERGAGTILYYGVDNVRDVHRALVSRGVAFEEEPHQIAEVEGRAIWMAVCHDGGGNYVGLING